MYSIVPNDRLQKLCIDRNWFTEGTNSQYDKMFRINERDYPLEIVAHAIWFCSEETIDYKDVLYTCLLERLWHRAYGIESQAQLFEVCSEIREAAISEGDRKKLKSYLARKRV